MKINDTRGLTLIEMLVSISILSIIVLAFFSTVNTSIKTNKKNEIDIKAMHLAQSEIENLRIQIKKSTDTTLEIVDLNDNTIGIGQNEYDIEEYKIKVNIKNLQPQKENSLLYEVNVIVIDKKTNKETSIITRVNKGKGI